MAQPVKDIITKVFASGDNWRFILLKHWPAIIGPLHDQVRIEKMRDDTLILGVYNAHWMQELYLLSRVIARKINETLGGKEQVRKLHFILISKKNVPVVPVAIKARSKVYKKHDLTIRERAALADIRDAQLRDSMKLFLEKITEE